MAISSGIFCNLSFSFFWQYVMQFCVNSLVVKLSNNQPPCIDYKPSLNIIDGDLYSKHDHYFWHCPYCAFPNMSFLKTRFLSEMLCWWKLEVMNIFKIIAMLLHRFALLDLSRTERAWRVGQHIHCLHIRPWVPSGTIWPCEGQVISFWVWCEGSIPCTGPRYWTWHDVSTTNKNFCILGSQSLVCISNQLTNKSIPLLVILW